MNDAQPTSPPVLRIVSGEPDDTEIAIITAIVSSRGSAAAPEPSHFSLWARKSRQTRPSLRPGFGAWRGSMMPR